MAIDSHWRTLNQTEASKIKALEQDVTCGVLASIIPNHAHRPCWVAHRQARKIVHREAVIARDQGSFQRGDVDRLGGCWTCTGRGGCQRQAREGDIVHHVLGGFTAAVEEAAEPVVLIGDVDSACSPVYGWICALVLTEISVTGSYDKVRSSRGTCAGDASVATIATGRSCLVTEVANSGFDHAAKAGAWSKLGVRHVQSAAGGID